MAPCDVLTSAKQKINFYFKKIKTEFKSLSETFIRYSFGIM